MLAFPLLFLLSLLFFRSLVAALLPLLIGGLAIVGTFLVLRIASEFGSISIFALNLTTGLGLGLAIDYSLFIVSRYREELAKRGLDSAGAGGRTELWEALRATMRTAGRTVLFSSITVAAALASLIVFPQRFLYSMGIGGALVALLAAAVALIVLPAVLSILGATRECARATLPPAPRRAGRDGDGGGLLVSALPLRDAATGPDRGAERRVSDRPRDPLPQHQVHLGRCAGAARERQRPPGRRRRCARTSRPSATRRYGLRSRAVGRRLWRPPRPRLSDDPGVAAVGRPQRLSGGWTVVDAVAKGPFISEAEQVDGEAAPRPSGTSWGDDARHRRLGALRRLSVEPRGAPAHGARDRRRLHLRGAVPVHRLGGAAGQGAGHERCSP